MAVFLAEEFVYLDGQSVGRVEGDAFVSPRSTDKHFFRKFQGFGESEEVLDFLFERGVKRVVLVVDRVKILEASVMDFVRFGVLWTDLPAHRKPDEQRVLNLAFFKTLSENHARPVEAVGV